MAMNTKTDAKGRKVQGQAGDVQVTGIAKSVNNSVNNRLELYRTYRDFLALYQNPKRQDFITKNK